MTKDKIGVKTKGRVITKDSPSFLCLFFVRMKTESKTAPAKGILCGFCWSHFSTNIQTHVHHDGLLPAHLWWIDLFSFTTTIIRFFLPFFGFYAFIICACFGQAWFLKKKKQNKTKMIFLRLHHLFSLMVQPLICFVISTIKGHVTTFPSHLPAGCFVIKFSALSRRQNKWNFLIMRSYRKIDTKKNLLVAGKRSVRCVAQIRSVKGARSSWT